MYGFERLDPRDLEPLLDHQDPRCCDSAYVDVELGLPRPHSQPETCWSQLQQLSVILIRPIQRFVVALWSCYTQQVAGQNLGDTHLAVENTAAPRDEDSLRQSQRRFSLSDMPFRASRGQDDLTTAELLDQASSQGITNRASFRSYRDMAGARVVQRGRGRVIYDSQFHGSSKTATYFTTCNRLFNDSTDPLRISEPSTETAIAVPRHVGCYEYVPQLSTPNLGICYASHDHRRRAVNLHFGQVICVDLNSGTNSTSTPNKFTTIRIPSAPSISITSSDGFAEKSTGNEDDACSSGATSIAEDEEECDSESHMSCDTCDSDENDASLAAIIFDTGRNSNKGGSDKGKSTNTPRHAASDPTSSAQF